MKDFKILKKEIEKIAQFLSPNGKALSGGNIVQTKTPANTGGYVVPTANHISSTKNTLNSNDKSSIFNMQSEINDFDQVTGGQSGMHEYKPTGIWDQKTSNNLNLIAHYIKDFLPFFKELQTEGLPIQADLYKPEYFIAFQENIPQAHNNIIKIDNAADLAEKYTQHLKLITALFSQYISIANKGQYRGLINGTQVIEKYPDAAQLVKAPGIIDKKDEIDTDVKTILENNPNAAIPVSFPGGKGIPLKALTDKNEYLNYMASLKIPEDQAMKIFHQDIKPQVQGLKV